MKRVHILALLGAFAIACGEPALTNLDAGPSQDAGSEAAEHACEERGTGSGVGDKLRNATFTNCLGDEVQLHDGCGERKLRVLAISTVWCPACKSYLRGLTFDHAISGGRDASWDYLIIVAQDATRSPEISLLECMAYANELGADPDRVVLDPNFTITLGADLIDVCGGGSISLPHMAILDGDDMAYEYSRVCKERYPNGAYQSWREAFLAELNE